jgi:hypothetical protein
MLAPHSTWSWQLSQYDAQKEAATHRDHVGTIERSRFIGASHPNRPMSRPHFLVSLHRDGLFVCALPQGDRGLTVLLLQVVGRSWGLSGLRKHEGKQDFPHAGRPQNDQGNCHIQGMLQHTSFASVVVQ